MHGPEIWTILLTDKINISELTENKSQAIPDRNMEYLAYH